MKHLTLSHGAQLSLKIKQMDLQHVDSVKANKFILHHCMQHIYTQWNLISKLHLKHVSGLLSSHSDAYHNAIIGELLDPIFNILLVFICLLKIQTY
jgi:hypothetical protein